MLDQADAAMLRGERFDRAPGEEAHLSADANDEALDGPPMGVHAEIVDAPDAGSVGVEHRQPEDFGEVDHDAPCI